MRCKSLVFLVFGNHFFTFSVIKLLPHKISMLRAIMVMVLSLHLRAPMFTIDEKEGYSNTFS